MVLNQLTLPEESIKIKKLKRLNLTMGYKLLYYKNLNLKGKSLDRNYNQAIVFDFINKMELK
jgi:hypothetical protein